MRFKNFSSEPLKIPFQRWVKRSEAQPGKLEGRLDLSILFDPGEVSDELEPEDPIAKLLLKAHPELRPFTLPTLWERILLDDPFDTSLEESEKAALLRLKDP